MMTPLTAYRQALGAALAALAAASAPGLPAQDTGPHTTPAPIEALIGEALARNHHLSAERALADAEGMRATQARARLLPSLDLDTRYSPQRGGLDLGDFVNPAYRALNEVIGEPRFPTDLTLTLPQRHDTRLRLSQPLFAPALHAASRAADRQARAADFQRRATTRRLAADVQIAFFSAAAAERAAAIRRAALELAREGERVANHLLEAGSITPDAVLRARAERSEAEQRLLEADDDARAALRALNRLVRRPLETPLDHVDDSLLIVPLPVGRDEAESLALARREEIALLGATAEAADAAVRVASAEFLPTVALAIDYGVQGNEIRFGDDTGYLVGNLVVSWNLFRGGGDVAQRKATRADALAVRHRQADVRDQVRLDVLRAYDASAAARAAIGTAAERMTAARRAYELVARRYAEGLAATVEMIDARTARVAAELDHAVALYRYAWRRAELERAAALRAIH